MICLCLKEFLGTKLRFFHLQVKNFFEFPRALFCMRLLFFFLLTYKKKIYFCRPLQRMFYLNYQH